MTPSPTLRPQGGRNGSLTIDLWMSALQLRGSPHPFSRFSRFSRIFFRGRCLRLRDQQKKSQSPTDAKRIGTTCSSSPSRGVLPQPLQPVDLWCDENSPVRHDLCYAGPNGGCSKP